MDLKLQLQTLCKEGSTIEDFLLHIKNISNQLNAISEFVSEKDLILCVVRDLDSSYNSFISSLSMQSGLMKFDKVHSLLLSYERMLGHQSRQLENQALF